MDRIGQLAGLTSVRRYQPEGAVVAEDVQDYALVVGVPARRIGWVCQCGERLPDSGKGTCALCGSSYEPTENGIRRTGGPR